MTDADPTPTTKDGEFYNEVVHERVVGDIENGSQIVDVRGTIKWHYRVKAEWSNLSEVETISLRSYSELQEYRRLDSRSLALEVAYGRRNFPTRQNWEVSSRSVITHLTTYLQIERPDGETDWVCYEESTTSPDCNTAAIAAAYHNNHPVTVDQTDDGYELSIEGTTVETRQVSRTPEHRESDELFDELFGYLAVGSTFVDGYVSCIRDDGERLFVDIMLGPEEVTLTFDNPKSAESSLWELVRYIGTEGDPLSIDNEDVEIAYEPFTNRTTILSNRLWSVREPAEDLGVVERVLRVVGLR